MSVMRISSFDFSVTDIQSKFVLDTNVLYFVHYGNNCNNFEDANIYSNFIGQVKNNGNKIFVSTLCLQELFNLVENKEYELYLSNNGLSKISFKKKSYRRNRVERKKLKDRFNIILLELKDSYDFIDANVTGNQIDAFINSFDNHMYDPIDYIMVDNLKNDNLFFVSNDVDFEMDSSIKVVKK